MIDLARRAYDHGFPFDPIVRSLLDTDFYKLLMQQFIWERFPNEMVTWKVTNRTKSVRIAEEIDVSELREQLDHVRTLRFTHSELIWLRGQSFYGQEGIFKKGYLDTLRHFKLPDYHLEQENGQFTLTFSGHWWETTMWEIHALAVINELLSRSRMRGMSKAQLDIMYARAKVKLYAKLERLQTLSGLNLSDFGTRRRHSFLWQEHCVLTACDVLGANFTGTSNVYLAMKHGLEAKGTNGHELPMVFAALARQHHPDDVEALKQAQYDVLLKWQNTYHNNLLVFLPDTFGTTQFLNDAPSWITNWKGARPDSKDPYIAGEELIAFWKHRGLTDEEIARDKLIIFSDGLDVSMNGHSNGSDIVDLHQHFDGRAQVGFGWGTNMTNSFDGCYPGHPDRMKAISLVCKVWDVNGHPAVKLSDAIGKTVCSSEEEIEVYRQTFGSEGMKEIEIRV